MALTSAITNQVARAATKQVTGLIKGGLKAALGAGSGSGSDTSALQAAQTGTKNLSYPLNVEGDEQQGHYIMFMINAAEQPKIKKGGRSAPGNITSNEDVSGRQQGAPPKKSQEAFRRGKGAGQSLVAKRPASFRLDSAISLYMPPSVQVQYTANYADEEIGVGAETVMRAGSKVIEAFQGPGSTWDKVKSSVGGAASELGQGGAQIGAAALLKAVDLIPTAGGTSALLQISAGAVIGSKFELQFTNIGRRDFSFSFNFLPKSEAEVHMVERIVQTFKYHMMPSVKESIDLAGVNIKAANGRILTIPDTFDIQYMYLGKENPYLNKISTCYLKDVQVQSGGDKYQTFEPSVHPVSGKMGPAPQKVSLTLAFKEIEIMTRDRIMEGY